MQVFKLYFKLLKSFVPMLAIYGILFIALILVYNSNQEEEITDYEDTRVVTAVVNYDEENALVSDFLNYLSGYCDFRYYSNEDGLSDALFFREVEYILTIPYEFGEKLEAGKEVLVEKKTVPGSIYSVAVDNAINRYLNTAGGYVAMMPGISEEELISRIGKDIGVRAEVAIESKAARNRDNGFYNNYYNVLSYIIPACCILGIGMVMLSFHNINIHRRNMVAPMSMLNLNIQLFAGNLIFVLGFDILFIVLGIALNNDKAVNTNSLLFWLNTFVFSFCCLAVSSLAALLVKSKGANAVLSAVLSLGISFISGAFLPQRLMSDSVLKIASFTPVYWFIHGNNAIAVLNSITPASMKEVLCDMAVQAGFAAAIFAVALVVSRNRSQRSY